jgi:hypothetical protein
MEKDMLGEHAMPAENGWILVNNEYHADSMGR